MDVPSYVILRDDLEQRGFAVDGSFENAVGYAAAAAATQGGSDRTQPLNELHLFVGAAREDGDVSRVVAMRMSWPDFFIAAKLPEDFFPKEPHGVGPDMAIDANARLAVNAYADDMAASVGATSELVPFTARDLAVAMLRNPGSKLGKPLDVMAADPGDLAGVILELSSADDGGIAVSEVTGDDEPPTSSARSLQGHTAPVWYVAIPPDGRHAVTASEDATARIWDLATGDTLHTLQGHTGPVVWVAITPDGRHAVTTSDDGTARIWDLTTGQTTHTLQGHTAPVRRVAITPDGRHAVTTSDDGTARIWDLTTGQTTHTLQGHTAPVRRVAITPDGRHAVTTSDDTTARIWDLTTGQTTHTLQGHTGTVWYVAITPDGRHAVTTSNDTTARIWDLTTGNTIHTLQGHTGTVGFVAITPDGRHAVTTSNDGTARIWDLTTGKNIHTLQGHTGPVWFVAITPDGRHAVTTSDDTTARIWDLTTGQTTHTLQGHTGPVRYVAITPDGQHAITTSDDTTARIWDLTTGEAVSSIPDPGARHQEPPKVVRDYWTVEDNLGYRAYASAIASFIRNEDTKPPLTIGVKGPWGAGKSSVMRMVQQQLDPPIDVEAPRWQFPKLHRTSSAVRHSKRGRRRRHEPESGLEFRELLEQSKEDLAEVPRSAVSRAIDPTKPQEDEGWRPTVWFNPWMYQTGEEVWAGLAQDIITQVTDRLPPSQRERFWMELNLRRVDRHALRRRLYKIVIERVFPALLALAASLGAIAVVAIADQALATWQAALAYGLPSAGAVGSIGKAIQLFNGLRKKGAAEVTPDLVRGPLAAAGAEIKEDLATFSEVMRDPDYETKAGFLYLIQNDIHHVLELVATATRPLVVFVDDLDRCSPGVVAQTIEAINLFLAGQFPNCIFVLAVEPAVVAAHVESEHGKLISSLEHSDIGSDWTALGWRFLEKIVQLPLTIPRPRHAQAESYLDSLLTAPAEAGSPQPGPAARTARREEMINAQADEFRPTPGTKATIQSTTRKRAEVEKRLIDQGTDAGEAARIATEAAVRAVADVYEDADPVLQGVVKRHALALPARNPREMKRFINLFRFYNFVAAPIWLETTTPEEQRQVFEQVATYATIAIRWPFFLNLLTKPVDDQATPDDGNPPIVLERLEAAARADADHHAEAEADGDSDDSGAWHAELVRCRVRPPVAAEGEERAPDMWARHLGELRAYLASCEPVGAFIRDFL